MPNTPSADVRVRVVRHALGTLAPPYPASSCSNDASDGSLSISAAPPAAGSVGAGILVEKAPGGMVRVRWATSCSTEVDDYAIYEGGLDALRAGTWDHAPARCDSGIDLVEDLTANAGARYYLVAPRAGTVEGSLGASSSGQPRPAAAASCGTREAPTCSP